MKNNAKFFVSVSFEGISLPSFKDILILGTKCPHGKAGISTCLDLIAPDDFELIEIDDSTVAAILVNKKILKRMPVQTILKILQERVFPYVTKGEIVKVDFRVVVSLDKIEVSID